MPYLPEHCFPPVPPGQGLQWHVSRRGHFPERERIQQGYLTRQLRHGFWYSTRPVYDLRPYLPPLFTAIGTLMNFGAGRINREVFSVMIG